MKKAIKEHLHPDTPEIGIDGYDFNHHDPIEIARAFLVRSGKLKKGEKLNGQIRIIGVYPFGMKPEEDIYGFSGQLIFFYNGVQYKATLPTDFNGRDAGSFFAKSRQLAIRTLKRVRNGLSRNGGKKK